MRLPKTMGIVRYRRGLVVGGFLDEEEEEEVGSGFRVGVLHRKVRC